MSRKIIWNNLEMDESGNIPYGKSGSIMYVEGGKVFYLHRNFDVEDNKAYDYEGMFDIGDYRTAVAKLQKTGSCELTDRDGGQLAMGLDGDHVAITFYGTPSPCASPGGTPITGLVRDKCTLNGMLLESGEKSIVRKVLYENDPLSGGSGTSICLEGSKVIFNHYANDDIETGYIDSFTREFDVGVYRAGVNDLLGKGECILVDGNNRLELAKRTNGDFAISSGMFSLIIPGFDFDCLLI